MVTFIAFFVILSVLVLIHELGHFWMAKRAGIYVEEFGFGIPPRLFGVKVGETIYSINWLPFGGFVRLYGEDATEEEIHGKHSIPKKRAFYAQSAWVKVSVIVAGVVMNFLLAGLAFSVAYSITGVPVETDSVSVAGVAEGSPAAFGGLQENDVITYLYDTKEGESVNEANKVAIHSVDQFLGIVESHKGRELVTVVERPGQGEVILAVTPRLDPPVDQGPLGVIISNVESVFYPWWQMPFVGIRYGFREALQWSWLIVTMLGDMLRQVFAGKAPEGVGGPVQIYQITGEVVKYGWVATLRLLGILSVNLAVLNIMPFPALDGGRLWFILAEAVTGKRVKPDFERWVHSFGMILLLTLMVVITIGDLSRLFDWNLGALFESLSRGL